MAQPLVSIIVPIYNSALDLVPCLESIKRQTYANIEVLLVNDGSSDSSLEICRMYARLDSRMIVIDKENSGVSGTRNVAIERAQGEYLQFVDSDDFLDRNATRLMVEAAQESRCDLLICHYCSVMPDGRTSVYGFLPPDVRMDKPQFARHLMEEPASFYYGVMWNKLYRAALVRAHEDVVCAEDLDWSEDLYFNLSYIRYAERFYALSTPIYNYYNTPGSAVHTVLNPVNVVTTRATLFNYYKELYEQMGLYEEYKPQIYKYLVAVAES